MIKEKLVPLFLISTSLWLAGCDPCDTEIDNYFITGQLKGAESLSCYPNNCQATLQIASTDGSTPPLTGTPSTIEFFESGDTSSAKGKGELFNSYTSFDSKALLPFLDGGLPTLTVVDLHTGEKLVEIAAEPFDHAKNVFDTLQPAAENVCPFRDVQVGGTYRTSTPIMFVVPTAAQ